MCYTGTLEKGGLKIYTFAYLHLFWFKSEWGVYETEEVELKIWVTLSSGESAVKRKRQNEGQKKKDSGG